MKYSTIFLLIVSLLCSCRSSRCIVEKKAVDQFNEKISLIKSFQEKNVEVSKDNYLSALIFLTNVTGVPSRAEYSHTFGYRNEQYYREDMQAWRKWLDQNRCKLTTAYIDTVLSKAKK
jgi:hypothetical protein